MSDTFTPIGDTFEEPVTLTAGDDYVTLAEFAEDDSPELHALAPHTWADVIAFAEREGLTGEAFDLAGDTEPEWTISRSTTWRIVVFALANRSGDGFYVNVNEITTGRYVNTRIMGRFADSDQALLAVDLLTRYINGWPSDTLR